MIRGTCLCKAVEIEISGTPRSLSYCHCSRCRKAEGVFAAVLIGAASDLTIVKGDASIKRYEPESPWTHRRAFCKRCGSALGELHSGSIYIVAASLLDDDPGLRPSVHLNIASKPNWYEITDGLKTLAGNYSAD